MKAIRKTGDHTMYWVGMLKDETCPIGVKSWFI